MNIKLYQVNMDRDEDSVAFLSLDNLRHTHPNAEVDPAIYDLVYSGDVNCKDLEEAFHLFNFDHPADFTGRSMSVSDVVETGGKFYFCDSVGFREIAFDAEKAGKSEENKIRVVLLEPGETAKITGIGSKLEDMQAVVGGCIEAVYPFEENVCIVCNEEGKINGLPLNRAMRDDSGAVYDAIAGTAFLCDCSGERFGSLSEEQCRRYQRQFRNPEQFVRIGGEILAIPYHPREHDKGEAR